MRARDVASTLWVTGPAETEYLLGLLLEDMRQAASEAARCPASAIATVRQSLDSKSETDNILLRGSGVSPACGVPVLGTIATPPLGAVTATVVWDENDACTGETALPITGWGLARGAPPSSPHSYGATAARAAEQRAAADDAAMRSAWTSAGASVVAVVTPRLT